MDKTPEVSVILPVYNGEKTLRRSIQSVLKQTYDNFELIVINDGSVDKSADILGKIAQKDSRVHQITQENQGVSAARNQGIRVARGKYLAFLDCDDEYEPEYLQVMVNAIEKAGAEVVMCGFCYVNSGRKVIPNERLYENKKELLEDFAWLISSNSLGYSWNKLYKKEIVQRLFREEVSAGEDLIFNLENMREVGRIKTIPKSLYRYYILRDGSLSRRYSENIMETFGRKKSALEEYTGAQWNQEHRGFLVNWTWNSYLRNVLCLCISREFSYKKKAAIFYTWQKHEIISYLKKHKKEIQKYGILLFFSKFGVWYAVIHAWNLLEKLHLKVKKTVAAQGRKC